MSNFLEKVLFHFAVR